jgi:iron complex outermembrane recepter protein
MLIKKWGTPKANRSTSEVATPTNHTKPYGSELQLSFMTAISVMSAMSLSSIANAEENNTAEGKYQLEEIIITANKREQSLLDVPTSIGVATGRDIANRGLQNLDDIAVSMPGITVAGSAPGVSGITIRGIAATAGSKAATSALYVDETPYALSMGGSAPSFAPDVRMFDIERVEVLRGPQGTLYGEGAMGGMVRIVTNKPDTQDFEASVQTQYFDYSHGGDGYSTDFMLNVPLIEDRLALRATGYWRDEDGYIDDVYRDLEDINDFQASEGRVRLRYTGDQLTVDLSSDYYENEIGAFEAQSNQDYQATYFTDTFLRDRYLVHNLTVDYDFGWANLVSASSYFDRSLEYLSDFSTPTSVALANRVFADLVDKPISAVIAPGDFETSAIIQELRLVSSGDQQLRYTAGLFYKKGDGNFLITANTIPSIPINLFNNNSRQESTQYALFGELEYDVTADFHAVLGLRWFREKQKNVQFNDGVFSKAPIDVDIPLEYKTIQPRFSLIYNLNEDSTIYATVSKGFRGGGVNAKAAAVRIAPLDLGGNPDVSDIFAEETLWNYELGLKGHWFDNRLSANLAGFHMEWSDMQFSINQGNAALSYTDNIGSAHSTGLELEVEANPLDGLTLTAGLQWIDPEVDDGSGIIPEGDRLMNAVTQKISVGIQYLFTLNQYADAYIRADYTDSEGAFSKLPNDASNFSGGFDVANMRLGLQGELWKTELFIENLTDSFLPHTSSDPLGVGTGQPMFLIRAPRKIGVLFRKDF